MPSEAKLRLLESEWELLRRDGWSQFGICSRCDKSAHVRGRRKGFLKCKECFFGP